MTKPTKTDPPKPLFGFLQPGEETTRRFSEPIPEGYVAVMERVPHSGVSITDQTEETITVANRGDKPSPYLVIFLTEGAVRAAMGAKAVSDFVLERWFRQ